MGTTSRGETREEAGTTGVAIARWWTVSVGGRPVLGTFVVAARAQMNEPVPPTWKMSVGGRSVLGTFVIATRVHMNEPVPLTRKMSVGGRPVFGDMWLRLAPML